MQNPPNRADVDFSHAMCTLALEQFEAAAKQFEQFTAQHSGDPRVVEATYRRAFAMHRMGRYDDALNICRSIKDPGSFSKAVLELGAENLFLLKRYDDAERLLVELIKPADTAAPTHLLRYGQCAYFTGRYKDTVDRLTGLATSGKKMTMRCGWRSSWLGMRTCSSATTMKQWLRWSVTCN
jgi:tetratricopeptide (TPR) repeat protein